MDTKFSVALHILVMISESEESLSSERLAKSVGTNSSYIRKVIASLKTAQIIESSQGKVGYQILKAKEDITLLDIYLATQEIEKISLFNIHKNANKECPVGSYIDKGLRPMFNSIEDEMSKQLASITLADLINNLYKIAGEK